MAIKQEYKELLLKDLCARLPYGVKAKANDISVVTINGILKRKSLTGYFDYDIITNNGNFYLKEVKPYLRPLSSMTDEELEAYHNLCFEEEREVREYGEWVTKVYYHDTIYSIDWLNKNMFDFRGLIPKDLALSTDEFNPYKD